MFIYYLLLALGVVCAIVSLYIGNIFSIASSFSLNILNNNYDSLIILLIGLFFMSLSFYEIVKRKTLGKIKKFKYLSRKNTYVLEKIDEIDNEKIAFIREYTGKEIFAVKEYPEEIPLKEPFVMKMVDGEIRIFLLK